MVVILSRNVNEGLIKVPTNLRDDLIHYTYSHILWWARDRASKLPKSQKRIDYEDEIKELAEQYYIDIPKKIKENLIKVEKFYLSKSDMPIRYRKLMSFEKKEIFLGIDLKTTKSSGIAGWQPSKDMILVRPLIINYIANYPNGNGETPLKYLFKEIESAITHELRHAVQEYCFKDVDKNQVKMNDNYHTDKSSYFTSPVEFDPLIGSCVDDFLKTWEIVSEYKTPNLQKSIKQYAGLERSSPFDMFATPPLFKELKKSNKNRYRIAVKKFFIEVKTRFKDMKASKKTS